MAKNFEEFRTHGKEMVDFICRYIQTIDQRDVYPAELKPGFLAPKLPRQIPEEPETFDDCLRDIDENVLPNVLHWTHPNFFAYFSNGNSYPSILGDMLSTAIASVGFSWTSCPAVTELEAIVLDWYAKALHLPEFFLSKASNPKSIGGGALQGSASDAIFACMMSARHRCIKKLKKSDNQKVHDSVYLPKLVCYTSSEAHSCVEKAAKMSLVKIRTIKPDEHDSMRGEALEKQIKKDIGIGLVPFFVVATLGTTGQAAFDNLLEISTVCRKYPSIWVHVDGAFGGNSFVVPEMRPYMAGMENVDSIDINPNKLMLTGFDSTCMWMRDVKEFIDAFVIDPLYLEHDMEATDLRHFGIPLSRRFRSMKMYFVTRMYGLRGMQEYIRRVIQGGKHLERLIKADDRFEIRNDVILGLVCFRLKQPDPVNVELLARLNGSGKIHLTPAKARGEYIIRFFAGQEYVSDAQVERGWRMILEYADELLDQTKAIPSMTMLSDIQRYDHEQTQRFSMTRSVTKEHHEKNSKNAQKLFDGATHVIVIKDHEDN